MIIAAVDSGYLNIGNYYIFKGVIFYYIYENDELFDKKYEFEIRNLSKIQDIYNIENHRIKLEAELANRANADIVLLDGKLDNTFEKYIENKHRRYWIPKVIYNNEQYFENDDKKIIKMLGFYRIETFIENQEYIDNDISIIKKYLLTDNIIYPFILYEADRYARVLSGIDYEYEVIEMILKNKLHERMLRNDKDLKI